MRMRDDPVFNLKTGADRDIYYAREVTKKGDDEGKIITRNGVTRYPVLTRSTGDSIKGSTENIESNELRKGRTKSAPRKGNSNSEGSIDIEFSPITYDDFYAAALRNEWRLWESDTDSAVNHEKNQFLPGYFYTKCITAADGSFGPRKLLNDDGVGEGDDLGLIDVPKGCVVRELTCGEQDIKFDILKRFGGVEGEDLWQRFRHMAVGSVSLNVAVGAIITGSVNFMGTTDPRMDGDDEAIENYGGDGTEKFLDGVTTGRGFIKNLPVSATDTDQFTAREGFMFINGKNIEFANAMDFTLDNGLQAKYAIFVRNAISMPALSLDITGNITTYLVKDGSAEMFNDSVDDKDNEILFTFMDNDDNPRYIYVFQIFATKFTDHDASANGSDTIDVSFPYQSFGEKAVRIFEIALPTALSAQLVEAVNEDEENDPWLEKRYGAVAVRPNIEILEENLGDITATVTVGDAEIAIGDAELVTDEDSEYYGDVLFAFDENIVQAGAEKVVKLKVDWNGKALNRMFLIEGTGEKNPVRFSFMFPNGVEKSFEKEMLDGSQISLLEVLRLAKAAVPEIDSPEPEIPGQIFVGWSRTFGGDLVPKTAMFTSDATLFAVFKDEDAPDVPTEGDDDEEEVKKITLTFTLMNGDVEIQKVEKEVNEGDAVTVAEIVDGVDTPEKPDNFFRGWSEINGGPVVSDGRKYKRDMTLYATFKPNPKDELVFRFMVGGVQHELVRKDKTPDGYEFSEIKNGVANPVGNFLYWIDEKTHTKVGDAETYDANAIFKAVFDGDVPKHDVTFTFTDDGAEFKKHTVQMSEGQTMTFDEIKTAAGADTTGKAGFDRWSETDVGAAVEGNKAFGDDTEFFAVYKVKVTFMDYATGDAGELHQVQIDKGKTLNDALGEDGVQDAIDAAVCKDGGDFDHWSETEQGDEYSPDTPIEQDIVLYAVSDTE